MSAGFNLPGNFDHTLCRYFVRCQRPENAPSEKGLRTLADSLDSVAAEPGSKFVFKAPIREFYTDLDETFLLPSEPTITVTSETGGFGAREKERTPRIHVEFHDAGFLPGDCFDAFPDELLGREASYSGKTLSVGGIVTAKSRGGNLSVTARQNAPSREVAELFLRTLAELEEAYQSQSGFDEVIADLKEREAELSNYPGRKTLVTALDAARANPGVLFKASGAGRGRYFDCDDGALLVPGTPIIYATSKPGGYGAANGADGLPRLHTSFWGNRPELMKDLWAALPGEVLGEEVRRYGGMEIKFGNVVAIRKSGRNLEVTALAAAPSRHVVNLFCEALEYVDSLG